jgi:glycerol kinase
MDELKALVEHDQRFEPAMKKEERHERYAKWQKAIEAVIAFSK